MSAPMEEIMPTDTAIARRRRPLGLEMRGLDDYIRLAEVLARSELVPPAYRGKPADIVVAMGMGGELGLSPFTSLQSLYVVQGRPSLYVEAALALVRASGELEKLEVDGTDEQATCTATRRGQSPVSITFTMEDARKLGLTRNAAYTSQPGWMLQTRAIGRALHRLFSDLLKGVGLVDPSGRAVEQGEPTVPLHIDGETGEVLDAASPKPVAGGNGGKLVALTARLAQQAERAAESEPERERVEEDAPPPAAPKTEGTMERTLLLSNIMATRDRVHMSEGVFARLCAQAGLTPTSLGTADMAALAELLAVLTKMTKASRRPEPA